MEYRRYRRLGEMQSLVLSLTVTTCRSTTQKIVQSLTIWNPKHTYNPPQKIVSKQRNQWREPFALNLRTTHEQREKAESILSSTNTTKDDRCHDQIQAQAGCTTIRTALSTPCNIALPHQPKVMKELARMEAQGVIPKVDALTPWCAGMVVVPKKSGSIRICVDLKPLNEGVLREVHPRPKVDETLAQLSGAKVLDANSGFWQIPCQKNSVYLLPSSHQLDGFVSTNSHSKSQVLQSTFTNTCHLYSMDWRELSTIWMTYSFSNQNMMPGSSLDQQGLSCT